MSNYWKEIERNSSTSAPSSAVSNFLVPTNKALTRRVNAAAGWLWAAAGLSVANLLLAYLQGPIRMMFSLFVTEVCFEIGRSSGLVLTIVALIFSAGIIAGVAGLGFFVRKCHTWAVISGMVIFALDAALIYFTTTLAGLAPFLLHGLAIYFLWMGLNAARLLNKRRKDGQA